MVRAARFNQREEAGTIPQGLKATVPTVALSLPSDHL
ncbi:hypothetical protein GGQ73_001008 [Rhizobium skierniewicense]|uniref:Uncharacterized protein n=1 Tax=Rhizobium skierniewicense TaxID=984260 RepID=A0A7W6C3I8_9HYPH|nr:hypothetical protein [Rhizobium skierniewicense]